MTRRTRWTLSVLVAGASVAIATWAATAHGPIGAPSHWPAGPDPRAHGRDEASASVAAPVGGPAEILADVPLRAEGGRLVVTAAGPDGSELDFVVGTGSATTVLTASARDRLGTDADVRIGDVAIVMADARTVPDSDLTFSGSALTGIVGANTLSRYDLLIDVPGGRLVVKEVGSRVEWPGERLSEPVRLRVYHGVVLGLDVSVNGDEYMAALDLTNPVLLMNQALAERAGLGIDGAVTLGIGSLSLPAVAARISDHPMFERWDPNGNGFLYVGAEIAADCPLALSWVHRELRTCVR